MPATNHKTSGVAHSGHRYQLAAEHALKAESIAVADEYLSTIIDSIKNQPRTLQTKIGPSQLGVDCERALLHMLNEDPEPRSGVAWKATIGTGVHAYLEDAFAANAATGRDNAGRWEVEQRVTVGDINGRPISGSTDLFDTWTGTVIDHKIIGRSNLKKYRAKGPSNQYRVQAHLYGRGWANAGHPVKLVAIAFLPREEDLSGAFIWTEPYQEQIAVAALARAAALDTQRTSLGMEAALAAYDPCGDVWCSWCGSGSSFGRRPLAKTTASLFAGAPGAAPAPAVSTAALFAAAEKEPAPPSGGATRVAALLGIAPQTQPITQPN